MSEQLKINILSVIVLRLFLKSFYSIIPFEMIIAYALNIKYVRNIKILMELVWKSDFKIAIFVEEKNYIFLIHASCFTKFLLVPCLHIMGMYFCEYILVTAFEKILQSCLWSKSW